jgi:hypothetical protein
MLLSHSGQIYPVGRCNAQSVVGADFGFRTAQKTRAVAGSFEFEQGFRDEEKLL